MDTLHKAFFSIFMITWGILMLVNVASICGRTARTFGRLRFWSLIPLWLYGPLVVLNPWWRLGHLDRGRQFLGIWLTLWPLISAIIATTCKSQGSLGSWNSSQRSRGCFYILCVDWAIILFLIVEVCRNPIPTGSKDWTFGASLGKIMTMFTIILLASQDVLLFPLAAFPRFISVPAIVLRRRFLPAQHKPVKRWPHDLNRLLSQKSPDREKSLATMLQNDDIAERVASYLHYDDVVNLSLTSKLMRTTVFYPSVDPDTRRDRIESLCIASCLKGTKSECWSCERVICNTCRAPKQRIRSSRIKDHFTHCYAVCTMCYLISAQGGAAPFNAKWNMQDLEMQHINCCSFREPQWEDGGGFLCRYCIKLDGQKLTEMREMRDEFYLSKTLPRNIDCAICMWPIGKRSTRWWFCAKGKHECHWAGHHT
ncbi:uncharacterized protein FPRO_02226 [Fusarium proliferatum ET1]|uniref:F-box domain-containing protein n=1 Tax=Fusarium proliferatum (strain ET1) TaxID=1227346 RepID=A0A1L7V9S2_FUSPR|nr:uncharacterized protein FPRO_02226 [Fusarium proliferatum ET1]CZR37513.1 uncharacterized protein FPRO_02226 [Fusarium proliferatum ET1]